MLADTRAHQVAGMMGLGSQPGLVVLSARGKPLRLNRQLSTLNNMPIFAEQRRASQGEGANM